MTVYGHVCVDAYDQFDEACCYREEAQRERGRQTDLLAATHVQGLDGSVGERDDENFGHDIGDVVDYRELYCVSIELAIPEQTAAGPTMNEFTHPFCGQRSSHNLAGRPPHLNTAMATNAQSHTPTISMARVLIRRNLFWR